MALCAPVRDMKDTAKVLSVVEASKDPVTVTRNGRDVLIVMTPEAYDGLKSELAHGRLMRRLDRAEFEFDSVECFDGDTFLMRCWIVTMLKLVVSKGAAMELRGIALYLEDELASPGAVRSFIQEFKHQAEPACSFPCSRPLCAHSELAQRGLPFVSGGQVCRDLFRRGRLSQGLPCIPPVAGLCPRRFGVIRLF